MEQLTLGQETDLALPLFTGTPIPVRLQGPEPQDSGLVQLALPIEGDGEAEKGGQGHVVIGGLFVDRS